MARVLVAGAGDVGATVASRCRARGDEVYGLRRDPRGLPAGITPVAADLTRIETLRRLPEGLDALVFCAAADRTDEAAYRAVYVDGLRNVLAAVGAVTRLVFTSTTGVYGQTDGGWVDEDAVTEPTRFTGRVMLEAEAIALASGATTSVLRLGGLYGPGRGRLIEQVRAGEAVSHDGPPVFTNRIHVHDAAATIEHVLASTSPPRLLNVVDDDPAERRIVLEWLAERLGVPAPPVAAATARTRVDNKRVANARLHAIGVALRYPSFREGYAELL